MNKEEEEEKKNKQTFTSIRTNNVCCMVSC